MKYPRSKSMSTHTYKTNQEDEVWFMGGKFIQVESNQNSNFHNLFPINDFGFLYLNFINNFVILYS